MKDNELYNLLLASSKKSLEILTTTFNKYIEIDPNIFITKSTWFKEQNQDTYKRQEIKQPDWQIILFRLHEEIEKTEEFILFSKFVKSNEVIASHLDNMVGTCFGTRRYRLVDLYYPIISAFLTNTGIDNFDESKFTTEYSKLENFLYSDQIEYETITPLYGLFLDTDNFLIDDNRSIVKLSESEISEMLRLGIDMGWSIEGSKYVTFIHEFAIKFTYNLPKVIEKPQTISNKHIKDKTQKKQEEEILLNAIRLFKQGTIYSLGSVTKTKNSFFYQGSSYNNNKSSLKSVGATKTFSLTKNEKNDFIKFWNDFSQLKLNISDKHFLSFAIRRFGQSNKRENIEDKLIDLLISAEALFLSSGGSFQGELKYRLSHRAAMFIENKPEKQKQVFRFMQKAYDTRSKIVHGDKVKPPIKVDHAEYSLEEFCKEIEEYLRISIKKAIQLVSIKKEIDWDTIIFPTDTDLDN